jgi:hypothetical protein
MPVPCPSIIYHLQVHEEKVFEHSEFVSDPKLIKPRYELLKKYNRKIIVTELRKNSKNGFSREIVSPEKLESLLALSQSSSSSSLA